ncbi:MAG TPA: hypothetical protein ENJ71_01120, partial [Epsilonproteobacteria bacterium]|nr:hypothetical protein [Campylobacterota bacterium]
MKQFILKYRSLMPFLIILLFSLVWLLFFYKGSWNRLLITSDQCGYKYYGQKEYLKAAETF